MKISSLSLFVFLLLFLASTLSTAQVFGPQRSVTNNTSLGAAADLDNDGLVDIIAGNDLTDALVWYRNLKGGFFDDFQLIADNVDPSRVESADTDNDGDIDVLFHSASEDVLFHAENLGGGNFGPPVFVTSAIAITDIHAQDLDGDGDADIICSGFIGLKLFWCENLGGSFSSPNLISNIPVLLWETHTADLDNDGDFDVLSASSADNKIAWYENLGGGSFGPQKVISSALLTATSVNTADLDGDGDQDVLAVSHDADKVVWFKNFGFGFFGPENVISNTLEPWAVKSADFDNDGDMDVASTSYADSSIIWFENLGAGSFGSQNVLTSSSVSPYDLRISDLDNDGDLDLIASEFNKVSWFENLMIQNCTSVPVNLTHTYTAGTIGGTLDLNWKEITGTSIYKIRVKRVSGGTPKAKLFGSTTNSLSIDGLFQAGDVFKWRVRAACAADTSYWSGKGEITIPLLRESRENTDEAVKTSAQISVYPNPATDRVTMNFTDMLDYEVVITDVAGQVVQMKQGSARTVEIDIEDLPAGIYFYRLDAERQQFAGNFVKE